jgi:hypothetical protein
MAARSGAAKPTALGAEGWDMDFRFDATHAIWLVSVLAAAIVAGVALWLLRRKWPMYRKELPRIYELRDLLPVPPSCGAYFRDLDRTLSEIPQKLRQYRDIEQDLQGLDPVAWSFLKSELAPLLTAKHPKRGWQPLFDKLNQAKAYNYLKRAGHTHVEFISPSVIKGQRTPDLRAYTDAMEALCEVKTINVSEIEANRRHAGSVGTIEAQLSGGFFTKLASDLAEAKAQIDAYDASPGIKRIAYMIVNFDDSLNEYGDLYRLQIEQHMKINNPAPDLDVVFDIKPPFYSAFSQ